MVSADGTRMKAWNCPAKLPSPTMTPVLLIDVATTSCQPEFGGISALRSTTPDFRQITADDPQTPTETPASFSPMGVQDDVPGSNGKYLNIRSCHFQGTRGDDDDV